MSIDATGWCSDFCISHREWDIISRSQVCTFILPAFLKPTLAKVQIVDKQGQGKGTCKTAIQRRLHWAGIIW